MNSFYYCRQPPIQGGSKFGLAVCYCGSTGLTLPGRSVQPKLEVNIFTQPFAHVGPPHPKTIKKIGPPVVVFLGQPQTMAFRVGCSYVNKLVAMNNLCM